MLYTKPKNMKYTDMAIYVDAHAADIATSGEHPDIEENVMRYLYCIVFMLAHKHKFFHTSTDYDHYAFYGAWHVYLGIKDKYNHQGEVVRGKVIEPIKSCLNLTKSLLYIFKANYQSEEFNSVSLASDDIDSVQGFKQNIASGYIDENKFKLKSDVLSQLSDIPQTLVHILSESPYKHDKCMLARLYISCLITFLFQITKVKAKENKHRNSTANQNKNILSGVVTWNLPVSLRPYIHFIVNKLCIIVNKEIEGFSQYYDLDDTTLNAILMSPYVEYTKGQEDPHEVN